jgi:putative oxidoreductase
MFRQRSPEMRMNRLLALPDRLAAQFGDVLVLLGRLLIAALFLPDAYGKIMGFTRFAESLGPKGLPLPTVWAVLAVIALVVGGIGVLLGWRTRLAAVLLVAFVIMANVTTHLFWNFDGPARATQAGAFWKNMSLVGGLLFLWVYGPGRYSVDGRGRTS